MNGLDNAPRRVLWAVCVASIGLLAFGLYLQLVVGLEPCPMCVVQRYALILIAFTAGITGATGRKSLQITGMGILTVLAVAGAYVAARQSWFPWAASRRSMSRVPRAVVTNMGPWPKRA